MARIVCQRNGPCILQGIATLGREGDAAAQSVRDVALCRCGGSGRKPVCDATHVRIGFVAPRDPAAGVMPDVADVRARLAALEDRAALLSDVIVMANGPYAVSETIELRGVPRAGSGRYLLCRCGASQHTPFCDGAHARAGFSDAS
jgi:CDGSH-type Zn-finger protein